MANPKYPAWVSQLSVQQLVDAFGVDTLNRGKAYATQGRVGHIAVGSGTRGSLVQAQVRGSSYRSYATVVRYDQTTGLLVSTCSCPMRHHCKHGAALLWHMRTVNLRALTPAWQLALTEVTADEVETFYGRWTGSYVEDRLRNDWLRELGRRRDWQGLAREYPRFRMNDDREVTCWWLFTEHLAGRDINGHVMQNRFVSAIFKGHIFKSNMPADRR